MNVPIHMPQMGQSVAEGTIVKWLKQVGDEIEADEVVVEVESDKIAFEIESPAAGRLASCLKAEGDVAAVGDVIGMIDAPKAEGQAEEAPARKEEPKPHAGGDQEQVLVRAEQIDIGSATADLPELTREWMSPYLMRLAVMNNIGIDELKSIKGTGRNGRLNRNDILSYLSRRPVGGSTIEAATGKPEPTPGDVAELGDVVPMNAIRRTIADHMVQSIRTSAHVTMVHAVDMTKIVELREQVKQRFLEAHGVKMTFTAVMLFVTARVLKEYPSINASVFGSSLVLRKDVNIGCAVALQDESLVVPVLHNADKLSFPETARELDRLIRLARTKSLTRKDVEGGTFTISNFGAFGSTIGTPIINQPQVAILGMGAILKAPVVVDGEICIRDQIHLSFSFDHRVIDGAMGGRFLNAIQCRTESLTEKDLDIQTIA